MTDRTAPPPHRVAWWSLAPAMITVAGSIGGGDHDSVARKLTVAVIAGVAGLAALTAPTRPRASVLVNGVAVGVYFAAGFAPGPIFLTVPLVAFLASQRARSWQMLTALLPALALMVAGLTVGSMRGATSAGVTFWQANGLITLALGASVLGWWLTDRRAARRDRAHRTATDERLRMAQDLHDDVGHGLAVISMHAAVALHVLDKMDTPASVLEAQLRQSLEVVRDTGRESLNALRVQLAAISGGPEAAGPHRPAPGLLELEDLLARVRIGGLTVVRDGEPGEVPAEVGQAVYSVVQEALTNVLRHAGATRAGVTLTRSNDNLVVTVLDDGKGPGRRAPVAGFSPRGTDRPRTCSTQTVRTETGPPETGPPETGPAGLKAAVAGRGGAGMGISGMRQRVERLGGTVESGFTDGGFLVRVRLPVPA